MPLFIIIKSEKKCHRMNSHAWRCEKSKKWKSFTMDFPIRSFTHELAQLCEEGRMSELFSFATHIVIHKIWIMYKKLGKEKYFRHMKTSIVFFFSFNMTCTLKRRTKAKVSSAVFLFIEFGKRRKFFRKRTIYYVNNRNKHNSIEHLSWTSMNHFYCSCVSDYFNPKKKFMELGSTIDVFFFHLYEVSYQRTFWNSNRSCINVDLL